MKAGCLPAAGRLVVADTLRFSSEQAKETAKNRTLARQRVRHPPGSYRRATAMRQLAPHQHVNRERPKVNRQRRKFCKSLICFWFPYSNQSCCAAPF